MESPRKLELSDLRGSLIRQEETIIFALIERSQFLMNSRVYDSSPESVVARADALGCAPDVSFLDYMLQQTEALHAKVGRYSHPDEHPFFSQSLPTPAIPQSNRPCVLKHNNIVYNSKIMSLYLSRILPLVSRPGDDGEVGSTAVADIAVLHAISKRVHYGKYIAEAKFQANREKYTALIQARDSEGLMEALTVSSVEEKLLVRVMEKAASYGKDYREDGWHDGVYKVSPAAIRDIYRDWIIPLTKEVEVDYLLCRLAPQSVSVGLLSPLLPSLCAAISQHFGEGTGLVAAESDDGVCQRVLTNQTPYGLLFLESSDSGNHARTDSLLLKTALRVCGEVNVRSSESLGANSVSRYLVVAKQPLASIPSGRDRTMLSLKLTADGAGALGQALRIFQKHEVNLTSLQSFPLADQDGSYAFHVEVDGHEGDPNVLGAMEELREAVHSMRVLGSYEKPTGLK